MSVLRLASKAVRLGLLRVGAGWMFALLTFNFNRTAISDLGAMAVIVATLIGLHHFLSPTFVFWGRFSDRHPILGFRRTPYILISSLGASLLFMLLPSLAIGLGERSWLATAEAFLVILVFGILMGMNGSTSNGLLAEITTDKERGGIVAFVWAVLIISGIASAIVAGAVMPSYDPVLMQQLYNLTPIVVMGTALLGVIGLERRVSKAELQQILSRQEQDATSAAGTYRVTLRLMRENRQVRMFAVFVLLAIMGIFLQDAVLEPMGAEVFGMEQWETARFQQIWGVGALVGMFGIGALSGFLPISKKQIATFGGLTVATGLSLVALSAATYQQSLITPALLLTGTGIGLFNVGALSMMMEMTIEGQAGFYMGIWGMSQGLGNGLANVFSGMMHTGLIETGLMTVSGAYTLIFGFEAMVMLMAIGILRAVSVQEFQGLSRTDVTQALALDTAG